MRALTGRDLDRLPEEKSRGITIELGFAPLELAEGIRIAVVDVPGHERFVRTMVAGASGIDLLLLVVAADEGVMPQTREHLAICELLGIQRGLAVLTKADLVDDEMLELAEAELRDVLAEGSLARIPILAASATTGDGIERVREVLTEQVRSAPRREDDERPGRLPVDRIFTKRGFGAVVTGTWSGRPREVGDAVALEPGGRRARIRGLERHGDAVEQTTSGARIAVNLQGLGVDEVHRGDVLAEPDSLAPTHCFDAQVRWLARKESLADATSIELLTGTTERRARIAPIGPTPLAPGETGFARVHVDGDPLPLLPGDRFVLRGFSRDAGVGSTTGGGRVLDVAPPHRRRTDPDLLRDLEQLAKGDDADRLEVLVTRSGLEGVSTERLRRESGLGPARLESALARLVETGSVARLGGDRVLAIAAGERVMAALMEELERFHAEQPLQPGMPRAALVGRLPANVQPETAVELIAGLARRGELVIRGEVVSRADFAPTLDAEESRLADALRERLAGAGLEAPALRALAEEMGQEVMHLRALAHYLERQGDLVAAPDELFFDRSAVETLIERVLAHFEDHTELDTQTLKALIGASRRTAMPLMALLDDLQITRRDGSSRRLVGREPRW